MIGIVAIRATPTAQRSVENATRYEAFFLLFMGEVTPRANRATAKMPVNTCSRLL